jgi:hypothetical protein
MSRDAVSGLVDSAHRVADTFENTLMAIPTPHRKVDTSWHDEMVRKANESFREAAEKDKTKRKAQGKLAGTAASGQKKAAAKKKGGRKRVASKR